MSKHASFVGLTLCITATATLAAGTDTPPDPAPTKLTSVQNLARQAWELRNKNQKRASYDALARLIKEYPEDSYPRYVRAVALFVDGREEESLSDFEFDLKHNPQHRDAHRYRALCLHAAQRYEESAREYTASMRQGDRDYEDTLLNRAIVYSNLKKYDLAQNDINEAKRLYPKSSKPFRTQSVMSMQKEDFRSAYSDLSTAIKNDSKDPELYLMRSVAAIRLNKYVKARDDLSDAIALKERSIYYMLRASTKVFTLDMDGAWSDFKHAASCVVNEQIYTTKKAFEENFAPK